MSHLLEASYPSTFRIADVQALGSHLQQHTSVSLIGMKRVGISNFLRFFLNHPQIISQFIDPQNHLLILVDLNNLVERSLSAFWLLLLKKIVDATGADQTLFTQSIQLSDLFFTLETIHKLLHKTTTANKSVTIFFLRFDRLKEVMTTDFFANLKGLKEGSGHLSFVFTSYRPLSEIIPVFTRSALSGFIHEQYIKPAKTADLKVIAAAYQAQYQLVLPQKILEEVIKLAAGHVQYLHLSLIALKNKPELAATTNLLSALTQEEDISFLSEELFTSLTETEQKLLLTNQPPSKYLRMTGFFTGSDPAHIFNPVFANYVQQQLKHRRHADLNLTPKEQLLFSLLRAHLDEVVTRDEIIKAVWPDEIELGVSDWSIDRLISRLRQKIHAQFPNYQIQTVITRGYRLLTVS